MRRPAHDVEAARLVVSLEEVMVGVVAVGAVDELERLAAVQRQPQATLWRETICSFFLKRCASCDHSAGLSRS